MTDVACAKWKTRQEDVQEELLECLGGLKARVIFNCFRPDRGCALIGNLVLVELEILSALSALESV